MEKLVPTVRRELMDPLDLQDQQATEDQMEIQVKME